MTPFRRPLYGRNYNQDATVAAAAAAAAAAGDI